MINLNKYKMGKLFKFSKYLLIHLFCSLLVIVAHGQKIKEFIVNKKDIKILTAVIVLGYLYKCINT